MSGKRGRRLDVEWQESVEELKEQYHQEKNHHRRTRLHGLWLLQSGKSLGEASELLDVKYRTLQRWVAWYRVGGLEEVLERTPGGQRGDDRCWLSEAQRTDLRRQADSGAFHTAQEAREWIESQWGIAYQTGSIYSLFESMGITWKLPRRQAVQANVKQQEAWKKGG